MIENEKNSQISTIEYPFHYLKGNKALKLLLALIKIDPSLGGLIIFGNTGTGKSEYLSVFQKIKLPLEVIVNCSYHCSPSGTKYCSSCNEVIRKGGEFELHSIDTPVRILKKEKISLTIFTTNLEAREISEKDPIRIRSFSREKFDKMIYGNNLVKSRYFISLWSYRLIQLIREITNGYLYYISRYQPDLNHETLQIARTEISTILTNS